MIRSISLLQAATVSIYPAVVQRIKFVLLWYEENDNNNKIKVTKI